MTGCLPTHRPSKAAGGIAAHGGTAQPRNAEEKGDAATVIIYLFGCFQSFNMTWFLLFLILKSNIPISV